MDITRNKFREAKKNAEIFEACPCTDFEKWGKEVRGWGFLLIYPGSIRPRRLAFKLFEIGNEGVAGRKSGKQSNGFECHITGFPLPDQLFCMVYPPFIAVIVKALFSYFPEIIAKMMGRHLNMYRQLQQVEVGSQVRLLFYHEGFRFLVDLIQIIRFQIQHRATICNLLLFHWVRNRRAGGISGWNLWQPV